MMVMFCRLCASLLPVCLWHLDTVINMYDVSVLPMVSKSCRYGWKCKCAVEFMEIWRWWLWNGIWRRRQMVCIVIKKGYAGVISMVYVCCNLEERILVVYIKNEGRARLERERCKDEAEEEDEDEDCNGDNVFTATIVLRRGQRRRARDGKHTVTHRARRAPRIAHKRKHARTQGRARKTVPDAAAFERATKRKPDSKQEHKQRFQRALLAVRRSRHVAIPGVGYGLPPALAHTDGIVQQQHADGVHPAQGAAGSGGGDASPAAARGAPQRSAECGGIRSGRGRVAACGRAGHGIRVCDVPRRARGRCVRGDDGGRVSGDGAVAEECGGGQLRVSGDAAGVPEGGAGGGGADAVHV